MDIKTAIRNIKKSPHYKLPSLIHEDINFLIDNVKVAEGITQCPHCFCMTKNICGKCGKVKK